MKDENVQNLQRDTTCPLYVYFTHLDEYNSFMTENKSTMIMLNPNHSDAVVPKKLETQECKGACRYIFVLDNNIFLSPIQDLEIRTYRIIILPAFVWALKLVCRPKERI
jgi:hypothetical protein